MKNRSESSDPEPAPAPPGYRQGGSEAIAGTIASLVPRIRADGPIPFTDFVAAALYDPHHGYYARRTDQVGRRGDFFTSVSAGPLFGRLLATRILAWWEEKGAPAEWRIIELGAHDGSLALDLLTAIRETRPDAFAGLEYAILEPLPTLAEAQRRTLAPFATQLTIYPDPADIPLRPAFLIANEVLDALPFHLIRSSGTGWQELGVGLDPAGRFRWENLGTAQSIAAGVPLRPAGYRTEVRPNFAAFLTPLARALGAGRMLWIDYGFERDDYYAPARTEGTLRTYHAHRAGDDPLLTPGRLDITAHVDFTAFIGAIHELGGHVLHFENQSRYLTRLARPWLQTLEGRTDPATAKLVRNFQTLTHPGQLGRGFHFIETDWP